MIHGISGYTLITDINNQTSRYDYTNSLITKITDPLNQTIVQAWYWTNDSSGGYQRSLKTRTDKRGLVTQYFYDAKGNVVTNIISGTDLTGDNQTTATNIFTYSANNLPASTIDPVGNQTKYVYGDAGYPWSPTSIERYASNGVLIATNQLFYMYATNVVVNGYATFTNQAFGLLSRSIRAAGSSDAATNDFFYDGRGFLTNQIKYSRTTDPNISNSFFYNSRGELVQQTDRPIRQAGITSGPAIGIGCAQDYGARFIFPFLAWLPPRFHRATSL